MPKGGGTPAGKPTPGHLGNKQSTAKPGGNQWNPTGESKNTDYAKGAGNTTPGAGVWNPGVPSPTVDPFMTAEDIMAYAQARQAYESQLAELDFNYESSVANTGYEKEQITKGAIKGKDDTNWDMAGRGLFRSSIRDADLFDIDATAEMRKTFLDTQLNALKLNTETQKHALDTMWNDPETGYLHGMELKKVSNAQGIASTMPPWLVPPHAEKAPPPPKPPGGTKPKSKFAENTPIVNPANQRGNGGTTYPAPKPPSKPKNKSGGSVGGRTVLGRLA